MSALLAHPLRIAGLCVATFVIIELATITIPDDSPASDVRFLVEGLLVLVFLIALATAGWQRIRAGRQG